MSRGLLLLALLLLGLASCGPDEHPKLDPTERLDLKGAPNPDPVAPGTYVHPGSELRFPLGVPGFSRMSVSPYNDEGTDVGVAYISSAAPRLVFTVYVYPRPLEGRGVPVPSGPYFERELEEVRKGRPDIKEVAQGTLEGTLAKRAVKGRAAEFEFAALGFPPTGVPAQRGPLRR